MLFGTGHVYSAHLTAQREQNFTTCSHLCAFHHKQFAEVGGLGGRVCPTNWGTGKITLQPHKLWYTALYSGGPKFEHRSQDLLTGVFLEFRHCLKANACIKQRQNCLCTSYNYAPRHEGVLRRGGIAPRILDLDTR
jgi:hypothetical protein